MANEQEKEKKELNNDLLQQQKALNKEGYVQIDILNQQLKAYKEIAQEQAVSKGEIDATVNLTKDQNDLAKKLSRTSRRDLDDKKKRNAFEKTYLKALDQQAQLQQEVEELSNSTNEKDKKRAEILSDILQTTQYTLDVSQQLIESYRNLDRLVGFFSRFEELVKDIPIVRNLFRELTEGSKVASEVFKKTDNMRKSLGAGLRRTGSGLVDVLITSLIGGLIDGLGGINKQAVAFRNNLNLMQGEAEAVAVQVQGLVGAAAGFDDLAQASISFSNAMQLSTVTSSETLRTIFTLTDRLGLSAEAAAGLYRFSTLTNQSFTDANALVIGQTKLLNQRNKINIKNADILNDIGTANAATLLTLQKFPGGIARAAYEARKFGLSLAALEGAGSNLLDFQSSIGSELEAELITGRQLNLQKAREAALAGDQITLARELGTILNENQGVYEDNVVAQEALAKSLGISRQEVAAAVLQRKAALKIAREENKAGFERLDFEEQLADRIRENQDARLSDEEKRIAALRELGREDLADKERAVTAQKALQNTLKQVGLSLAKFVQTFTGTSDPLSKLTDAIFVASGHLDRLNKFLEETVLRAKKEESDVQSIAKQLQGKVSETGYSSLSNQERRVFDLIKKLEKDESKFSGRNLFGLGLSAYEERELKDKILAYGKPLMESTDVDDFTIRTNPKDTLVMAGGTKLGDETNMLLKELITAVKSGGHVYLDGRKVGESLALSYNTQ